MSLSSDRPIVFAHRGASGYEYENSFSAFKYAITLGADGIETDCWLSKDREVIVHHDLMLRRSPNGDGDPSFNIHNMTLEEIQSTLLPNGERILSLREFFEHFGSKHLRSNRLNPLEFSIDAQDDDVGLEIVKLLEEFCLIDRVVICCNTLRKIRNIRQINQQVHLVASGLEYLIKPRYLNPNRKMNDLKIKAFNIKAEYFLPRMKQVLDKFGYKYYIWDLQTSRVLRNYLSYFPNAIYSDYPDKALKALKSKK